MPPQTATSIGVNHCALSLINSIILKKINTNKKLNIEILQPLLQHKSIASIYWNTEYFKKLDFSVFKTGLTKSASVIKA